MLCNKPIMDLFRLPFKIYALKSVRGLPKTHLLVASLLYLL